MKANHILFNHPLRACLISATAALCSAGLASATVVGSGNVVSETRVVSGFHGFNLSGSGDVIVMQGDTEGLVIEAEDNILPLLESTVDKKGILHLGFKEHTGSVSTKKTAVFKLAAKTLDRMELEGSGNIQAASLSGKTLGISLPGSGHCSVDRLQAETLKVDIDGSGSLKLAGEAHSQAITFNGSGKYEGESFKTDETKLQINGSGDAKVWANASLTVEVNGSGDIAYKGSPKIKQSINGLGKVHPLAGN